MDPKRRPTMQTKTKVKAGSALNHNRTGGRVRTGVKAGTAFNHNRTLAA
jgi:hypothetical protein